MIPRLSGYNSTLDGSQNLLCCSQAQAQIRDVAQVIRLRNLNQVRAPIIAIAARFHQQHDPGHSHYP